MAVTGAGDGMGRAMAFAREGETVMACDVNAAGPEAAAAQLGAAPGIIATMIVDVRDEHPPSQIGLSPLAAIALPRDRMEPRRAPGWHRSQAGHYGISRSQILLIGPRRFVID